MLRILRSLVAAAGAMLCSIAVASAMPTRAQILPYLQPQQLVDVGGHRLNVYCTGNGSPAVILDAGEGETMFSWRKVQPKIAAFTRVCSFDRAGMGFSGAGPLPRDARAMVSDLHALLRRANVAPPYVLVGHSIAGLYALLYADRYRDDVAGMVLVDPSFPNQSRALHAVSPTMAHMEAQAAGAYAYCYRAALHGRLGVEHASKENAICGFPPSVANDIRNDCAKNGALYCKLEHVGFDTYLKPGFWSDLGSEDVASDAVDSTEDLAAQRPYGAMPMIVLTAADDIGESPLPAAEMRGVDRVWTAGHDRLARLSSVGANFRVTQSEHYIQLDRPAVVVGAVAEVVSQTKPKR